MLLLFGAGLLLRTLLAVENVDRGYRADSVLTMMVDPLGSRYPTATSLLQFFDAVEQEIMALPGRRRAWPGRARCRWATRDAGEWFFEIVGDPPVDESQRPPPTTRSSSPDYFQTLDLPIVAGRAFNDRDTRDSVPVCIVNEALRPRASSGPIADRPARRAPVDVAAAGHAGRERDRRCRPPGEGPAR